MSLAQWLSLADAVQEFAACAAELELLVSGRAHKPAPSDPKESMSDADLREVRVHGQVLTGVPGSLVCVAVVCRSTHTVDTRVIESMASSFCSGHTCIRGRASLKGAGRRLLGIISGMSYTSRSIETSRLAISRNPMNRFADNAACMDSAAG